MNPSDFGERSRSISSTMLAGVMNRQPESWDRLVDVWGPVIYNWCRKKGVQEHDAADIVQEVFARVFLKIPDFDHETFRGWIWTITHHIILDHFRRGKRQPIGEGGSSANRRIQDLPDPDGNPPDGSIAVSDINTNSLIVHQVLKVIRRDFDERTFQAFWRTTIDGLSAAQVAEELGMTAAAVRQAKCRVLKRLREELEAMGIRVTPPRCT